MNPLSYFWEEKPVEPLPAQVGLGPPSQQALMTAQLMASAGPIEDDFNAVLDAFKAIMPFAAPLIERVRWVSFMAAPLFRAALAAAGYKIVRV
jgi:hypothetical protein